MTFSVIATCERTGEFGCAFATSSTAVGARVAFIVPEFGVVLSQGRSDPRLGAVGIASLRSGSSAQDALADMIDATQDAMWRQLAVMDVTGRFADFTGDKCTDAKAAKTRPGVLCLGNGLMNEEVIDAMLEGYATNSTQKLADRLLDALEKGLTCGGERGPIRSAGIRLAQPGIPFTPTDLRIDYSEKPLEALRTLWQRWRFLSDGYVQRALDPSNSPAAANLEPTAS